MPDKQSDFIKIEFIKYLNSLGISPASHKNYKSDLVHFIAWAILKVRSLGSYVESLTEIVPFLNIDMGHEYKSYMAKNTVPAKTMNRRLSTLRHLSKFLQASNAIESDFTEGIENASKGSTKKTIVNPISGDFKAYLVKENVSANTIKNYLSDIKHFLLWLEQNDSPAIHNS
jgi:site-specific recombinase XerD